MRFAFIAILAIFASPAVAEPALGIWQTEPDRKNLTSHIKIEHCGTTLCGTILQAFNEGGQKVMTPNIGKRLFWDLRPAGSGDYVDGTVWVPLMDVTARAKMALDGEKLRVTGCKGIICDGQIWTRVN
ncbi:MAG: DUF2147 domain-containing protein [Pseudomonadota bacterium]